MAVGAEDGFVCVGDPGEDGAEELEDFIRRGVADRVRQVDRGGSCLDNRLDDPTEKVEIAPRRVLGRELDVVGVPAGLCHRGDGGVEALLAADVQLAFEMQVRSGDERVNAAILPGRERFAGAFDVVWAASRQGSHHGAIKGGRDHAYSFGIRVGGDREARLDHIDAQAIEMPGQLQLFRHAERKAGRLLAIAQRRVEDRHAVCHEASIANFRLPDNI